MTKGASIAALTGYVGNVLPTEAASSLGVSGRIAAASATGGLASAVAGGNGRDIRDGMLLGAVMAGVQETYRSYTGFKLEPKGSAGEASCKADACYTEIPVRNDLAPRRLVGEKPIVDIRSIPAHVPQVGKAAGPKDSWLSRALLGEKSPPMVALSRIPSINQMAVFHDMWAIDWNMPFVILESTIIPATIYIYSGTAAPMTNHAQKSLVRKSQDDLIY